MKINLKKIGEEKFLTIKLGETSIGRGLAQNFTKWANWKLGRGLLTGTDVHKKRITDFSISRLRLYVLYRHRCVQEANYGFQTKSLFRDLNLIKCTYIERYNLLNDEKM